MPKWRVIRAYHAPDIANDIVALVGPAALELADLPWIKEHEPQLEADFVRLQLRLTAGEVPLVWDLLGAQGWELVGTDGVDHSTTLWFKKRY
ncbi:MAG: hypothetical protein QOF51_999 [Chloroflexota bacterium]|jgi:hypothetical protein|nr:hypothetical protein [Chloroflexota bacterium]